MRVSILLVVALLNQLAWPALAQAAAVSFEFALDRPCTTSAGVYDSEGRMVCALWGLQAKPAGKQQAAWDGMDDLGHNVPPGPYQVRVAYGPAECASLGTLGNSGAGRPMQAGTDDLLVDRRTGDIYTANNWEEAGQDFRKMDAQGKHLMDAQFRVRNGTPNGWPIALALERGVLYCSVFTVNEAVPGQSKRFNGGAVLRKFTADKGEPIAFPTESGYIRVKTPDPNDETPFDHQSLHSIAICGNALVAADRHAGRVYTFDKTSGRRLGEFALTESLPENGDRRLKSECPSPRSRIGAKPVCVIADAAGRLWIAHDGGRVSVMNLQGKTLFTPQSPAQEIVCIRFGPENRLWVADQATGRILVYRIDAPDKLELVKSYGHKAKPGEFGPLAIGTIQSFDVMPEGGFVLAQTYGHGSVVTRFSSEGGVVWQQVGLEFCTNGTYDQAEPDLLISSLSNAYRLLDRRQGAWRFEGCLYQGPLGLGQSTGTPRILTLGGRRFYFSITGDAAVALRFDGHRLTPAAIVGFSPRAWDKKLLGDIAAGDKPDHFAWHDANGDGAIQPQEISRVSGSKAPVATFSCEVDPRGSLVFPNHHTNAVQVLPLAKLDPQGNPVYDWSARRDLLPRDDTLRGLRPMKTCPLPDGGMYVLHAADPSFHPPVDRETGYGKPHQVCWMGGWLLSKYDPRGRRLFTVPLPDHCTGMDWIPNVGRSEDRGIVVGVYTAMQLYHYSPEGLLLGVLSPKHQTGWLDHNGSVSVNRNPQDGLLDVFAEESFCNRISWYRMDDRGVQTVRVAVRKDASPGEQYACETSLYEALHAAQAHFKAGRNAAAVDGFRTALQLASDREKPFVRRQLGEACRANGQVDQAIEQFLAVLDAPAYEPEQKVELLFAVARLQSQERRFDAAVATMNRVGQLKFPPDRHYLPQAMLEVAGIHAAAGKIDAALAELHQVKKYFKTAKYPHPNLLWQTYWTAADYLRRQRKHAEAIREYEQSLAIREIDDNALARSQIGIAECHAAQDNPTRAAEHYLAAADRHAKAEPGTLAHALLAAGECLAKAGDKAAAKRSYQRLIDLPGVALDQKKAAAQRIEQLAR